MDRGERTRYDDIVENLVVSLKGMLGRGRVGELFSAPTTTRMRRDVPVVFDISSIKNEDRGPDEGVDREALRQFARHSNVRSNLFPRIHRSNEINLESVDHVVRLPLAGHRRHTVAETEETAAFVEVVALWWGVYFERSAETGAQKVTDSTDPGRLGRSAYHFIHPIAVAGIIVTVAADQRVLAHPAAASEARPRGSVLGRDRVVLGRARGIQSDCSANHRSRTLRARLTRPVRRTLALGLDRCSRVSPACGSKCCRPWPRHTFASAAKQTSAANLGRCRSCSRATTPAGLGRSVECPARRLLTRPSSAGTETPRWCGSTISIRYGRFSCSCPSLRISSPAYVLLA